MSLALLLILSVALACGLNKPWRHYEQKPFDAQQWRDGDAITRGTMIVDLFKKRTVSGKSRDGVVELLGEPDKKTSSEGSEVWLYRIEVTGETPRRYFPVSFDKEGRASAGRAQAGTMSMVVDE
jgi:hypothetical protein